MFRGIPGHSARIGNALRPTAAVPFAWCGVVGLLMASLVGCTESVKKYKGSADDTEQLIHYIRTTYLRAGQPIEVTKAKITNVSEISDELYRVEFEADATLIKATYLMLDKGRMLSAAGWNETEYVAALQAARNLPADVRTKFDRERPSIDGETRFFRAEGNEGQKLQFKGRYTARFQVTTWNLNELEMNELMEPDQAATPYDLKFKVSILPPNSLEITGAGGKLRIKNLVDQQKKYVAEVNAASATAAKGRADMTDQLLSVAKTGAIWIATLPDGNRPAQKWFIEFIDVSQGEVLRAVVRHPTDELQRRVFTGRVVAGNSPEIVMEPLENSRSLIYGGVGEILRIRPGTGTALQIVVNNNIEGMLERAPEAVTTKPEAELWSELIAKIQPGTQWTGTARTGTDVAGPIKLTFVDLKPDGSYVRAVGETPSDPTTAVVFEGIVNRAGVHGWPIVMKAVDSYAAEGQARDYFAPAGSTLVLAAPDNRFVGHRGLDALQFTSSSKIEPWVGRDQVAAKIFAPGTKLTGRVDNVEGSTQIDLTVADVRDDGAYVRVLVQAKDDPFDCVVYEGRFPFKSTLIDGYALELNKRTGLQKPESIFRNETGTTLRLRLALDGGTVLGVLMVAGQPESTLTLKIDEARKAAVDISTEPFAAFVKGLLTKNSQWRGTLRDLKESRSAEVMMRITDVNLADGITCEFTIPRTAGAKAVYEGIFQLGDLTVNAQCAALKKMVGGKAEKSAMFDSSIGEDRKMKFLLAPDGVTLYVQTTNLSGERIEQLTLRSTTLPRPVGVSGGLPSALAPTPSGTRPVSGLLKPVTP